MVLVKKGTGKAYVGLDLQSAVHIQRFATVCKALKASTLPIDNKQNLTEAFLATISAQLFQHYQQCFGKSSPKPRPFTIPPTRLFWDFEADGALFVMLSTLLSSASVRDLAPLDKLFERDAASLLPILHEIDKNLSLFGYTTTPKIFLNSVPVGLIQKLSKIAVEHGGELVSSEELATHVLDWNDDVDSAADAALVDDANARVIDYKPLNEDGSGSLYLVHWPFLPDSANEWLAEAQLALTAAEQQVAVLGRRDKPRYYVSCRFLLDVDTFNEWGNEGDYEASAGGGGVADGADDDAAADALPTAATAATATPAGRKTAKGRGRRSSAAAVSAVKAQAQAKDAPAPPLATALYEKLLADVLPPALTRSIFQTTPPPTGRVLDVDFTGARLVTASAASSSSTAAGSLSRASSQANLAASAEAKETDAAAAPAAAAPSSSSGSAATKKRKFDELAADGSGAAPAEPLLWLRLDRVSDLERRLLGYVVQEHRPQGVSSYLQLRNAMLQLYAQRPAQYLSATECRRKIAGDVARLTRVHEFLDAFGAINYAVKAEARPIFAGGAPGYDDDASLSLRRRHLVDRLARQFPSCAVHAQAAEPHATAHWHAAMDARLVALLLEKSMDWPVISRDMAAWLEAQYAAPAPAADEAATAPAAATAAVTAAATATATTTTTADAMDADPPAASEAGAAAAPTASASAAGAGGDSDATLRAMTSAQRAALVTPLLCMLRFMEMQLAAAVRTAAAAPTATANGATATATAAVTASNGAVVKEETAGAAATAVTATVAPAASSSGSGSGSGERAHALFVQLATLAQRPPSTPTAGSPWATDKERAVLTRLVAAVTQLQQLDALLGDLRAENAAAPPSAASAAPTTTAAAAAAGDDDADAAGSGGMDVDDDGDSGAAPAPVPAATPTPAPTSAAQAAVASFAASLVAAITAETTTFLQALRDRQRSLTEEMFAQRLAALEDKLALVGEVDAVLALEREQLEADKRDFALQRLLHLTTAAGIALSVPNTLAGGHATANGAVPHAASLPALTLGGGGGGGGGGGLTTSSSSAALNAL